MALNAPHVRRQTTQEFIYIGFYKLSEKQSTSCFLWQEMLMRWMLEEPWCAHVKDHKVDWRFVYVVTSVENFFTFDTCKNFKAEMNSRPLKNPSVPGEWVNINTELHAGLWQEFIDTCLRETHTQEQTIQNLSSRSRTPAMWEKYPEQNSTSFSSVTGFPERKVLLWTVVFSPCLSVFSGPWVNILYSQKYELI